MRGYAEKMDGYEAVVQYNITPKFKPSLANTCVPTWDSAHGIDDTATEYVSVGAWYNFTDNFNAYVDYKINLLDEVGSTGKNSLNKSTDDIVAVALQYNFCRPGRTASRTGPWAGLCCWRTALDDKSGTPGSAMAPWSIPLLSGRCVAVLAMRQ